MAGRRGSTEADPAPAADLAGRAAAAHGEGARADAAERDRRDLIEAGPSLDYFTGVQWCRSERLTAAVIPAQGDPIIVTPFFESPSIKEMLAIPAEVRTWNEDEEPLKLVADFLSERGVASAIRSPSRKPTASSSSTAGRSSFQASRSSAPIRSSALNG